MTCEVCAKVQVLGKMGEEACRDCRSWQENIYWNHFQSIHFSQFLHAGFDQHLVIPEKFSRNLKKKLPDTVTLKGPSGAFWKVGVMAKDDILLFNKGWEEFVKDHSLQEKDILMFRYNGDLQFDVLIFDRQTMCEKETSYFVKKCGHSAYDNGFQTTGKCVKDSVEVLTPSPRDFGGDRDIDSIPLTSFIVKKRKHIAGNNGFPAPGENVKNSVGVLVASPGEVGGGSQVHVDTIPVGVPILTSVSKKRTRQVIEELFPKRSLANIKEPSVDDMELETRVPTLTLVAKKRTRRVIEELCAQRSLANIKQPSADDLELETVTKQRTRKSTKRLHAKRSLANIKEPSVDDMELETRVPTLTLVAKKRTRRVIEELCAQRSLSNIKQPSADDLELETVTKERTPKSTKRLHAKRSLAKKKKPSTPPMDAELEADFEYLGEKTMNINTLMPHASDRRLVTEEEKGMAMQLALSTLSKDGFFVVMKPSSVYKRFFMSIPSAWFTIHLTSLEHQDMILRREEKTWATRFYYQEARKSGGLSSGWKHFVEDNSLHEHDVCVFEPASLEDRPFVFDVSIFRAVPEHGPLIPASE